MRIEFDPAKNEANVRERGLSFEMAEGFDFGTAVVIRDLRKNYPEPRYYALGYVLQRLHALVFTPATGGIRVISFRKANAREGRKYEQATQP